MLWPPTPVLFKGCIVLSQGLGIRYTSRQYSYFPVPGSFDDPRFKCSEVEISSLLMCRLELEQHDPLRPQTTLFSRVADPEHHLLVQNLYIGWTMAARLGAARLVLPALNARTLCRRHHIPLRAFVASTPTHIVKPFVPPASLGTRDVEEDLNDPEYFPQPARQRPPTSTFYTTRSDYYEVIGGLQDAIHSTRATLKSLHLHPLPKFALDALPSAHPAWADRADMGAELDVTLSAGMYRQLILSLKELELYHRIAKAAGITELHEYLGELIGSFESTKQVEARERRILKQAMVGKRAKLDVYGRSYTLGRRKTSTARVWMIKVQDKVEDPNVAEDEPATTSVSTLLSPSVKVPSPPTTSVLINSAPISEYFPLPADRETILRPLKLAGLLGAYNVFALVRGGGTSGQSGALALAISRACVSHVPEVEPILRKGTLSKSLGLHSADAVDVSQFDEERPPYG